MSPPRGDLCDELGLRALACKATPVALVVALGAGCADGVDCREYEGLEDPSRTTCICDYSETRTDDDDNACNEEVTGGYCCDEPGRESCTCRPAPECNATQDRCLCGGILLGGRGVVFRDACPPAEGRVRCCLFLAEVPTGSTYCECSADVVCDEDQLVAQCNPEVVSVCAPTRRRVDDCRSREPFAP